MGPSLDSERDLSWLNGPSVSKRQLEVWKVAPLCFYWKLWKERNTLFSEWGFFFSNIEKFFICSLWSWTCLFIEMDGISFSNYLYVVYVTLTFRLMFIFLIILFILY